MNISFGVFLISETQKSVKSRFTNLDLISLVATVIHLILHQDPHTEKGSLSHDEGSENRIPDPSFKGVLAEKPFGSFHVILLTNRPSDPSTESEVIT